MTRTMIFSVLPFAWLMSCVVEDAAPTAVSVDGPDDRAAHVDPEAAPVCDPDKTLERVSCRLDLNGSYSTRDCEVTLADVVDDGMFAVIAANTGDCMCEWTPPGSVGDQTAACGDLDAGYDQPTSGAGACAPVSLRAHGVWREGYGYAESYEEAELYALGECEAAVATRCTTMCANYKANGEHVRPVTTIDCCVPRSEACDEGCTTESGSEGGSEWGESDGDSEGDGDSESEGEGGSSG